MTREKDAAVLVIDDQWETVTLIGQTLKTLGYITIDELTDSRRALDMIRQMHYDVVISDWNMFPVSGYELLQAVRADEALKSLPFILITGAATEARVHSALDAGVTHFISKPFTARILDRSLRAVLAS